MRRESSSLTPTGASFRPQRHRGIGATRLQRWNPRRGDARESEQQRNCDESHRVRRRDVIEQRAESARCDQGGGNADRQSDRDQSDSVFHHQPTYLTNR